MGMVRLQRVVHDSEVVALARPCQAALEAQGIAPAGPWLTYRRRLDPNVFDFEIAVPVTRRVSPVGRVRPGSLAAATVARVVHRGGYEGLPAAWPELDAWIADQGDRPRGDFWERYVRGPETSADPATWETELNRVLV
jgi:effector-binding domain-containing protein